MANRDQRERDSASFVVVVAQQCTKCKMLCSGTLITSRYCCSNFLLIVMWVGGQGELRWERRGVSIGLSIYLPKLFDMFALIRYTTWHQNMAQQVELVLSAYQV